MLEVIKNVYIKLYIYIYIYVFQIDPIGIEP